MLLSTTAWCFYALSVPNMYIFAANAPGVLASLAYVLLTLPLIPHAAPQRAAVQLVLVAGAAFKLCLWGAIVASGCDAASRSFALGLYGSLLCVLMFAAPLSTMATVIASANAASIYAPLTAAQCVNCGTWTFYGFAIGDIWVWGPNACGLVLGLVQVALKLVYPSSASSGAAAAAAARPNDDDVRRRLKDLAAASDDNDDSFA
jgi:solute carrier family 50 protein (sugar transporter)